MDRRTAIHDGSARMVEETGTRRAALVTGAASGIGRPIAEAFEHAGYGVLAADLAPDDGPGVAFTTT
jgi:hypothetical protein